MKTQFGEVVTGNFEDNTLTIEVEGEMEIAAGKVAVISMKDYDQYVKHHHCTHQAKDPNRKHTSCVKCGTLMQMKS